MNTEHQNPKTQLPRAIEEKPIVYDDEQLEEVREVATLPPIQLSPDEIEFAISLFARGFGRGDVVTILIEESPERETQARADSTFRKRFSDRLRICDPTSAIFAESRFKNPLPPAPRTRPRDPREHLLPDRQPLERDTQQTG